MSDTIRPACLSPGELAGLIRQAADWGRAGGRHAILCESIHRLCAHVAYLDELLHRFTTDHDAYLAGRARQG